VTVSVKCSIEDHDCSFDTSIDQIEDKGMFWIGVGYGREHTLRRGVAAWAVASCSSSRRGHN
jgi:hypothetical protein